MFRGKSLKLMLLLALSFGFRASAETLWGGEINFLQMPVEFKINGDFEETVSVDIHLPKEADVSLSEIVKEVSFAQKVWSKCGIGISISQIFTSDLSKEIATDYESLAFHSWKISDYEKILFKSYHLGRPSVIYVNFLDWSYNAGGTRAISYPPFLIEDPKKIVGEDELFYKTKMMGSAILTSLRDGSTLAHEWGHSLFNLKHSDVSKNIMIGTVSGERRYFEISEAQCETAKKSLREYY